MNIVVISIFPEMFEALLLGMPGLAQKKDLLTLTIINPRDFTLDAYRRIDDRPYGGGPGMLMLAEPLSKALNHAKALVGDAAKVIYLSPQGALLKQPAVTAFAQETALILIAGRYEGIDERFIELFVDEEWSMGDYVLSGGELPAMVLIDALSRLLPGVLHDPQSAQQDSFSLKDAAGQDLLDCPHYTRPEEFMGKRVPAVLLSGNHQAIAAWRQEQSMLRTRKRRPDLSKVD